MIVVVLITVFVVGYLAHRFFYPALEEYHSERERRLSAYAIGMLLDIFTSWMMMVCYHRKVSDRRKRPMPFERWVLVRFLAAGALGLGVVLGYMLDKE